MNCRTLSDIHCLPINLTFKMEPCIAWGDIRIFYHYRRIEKISLESFYHVYLQALNVIISSPWAICDEQLEAAMEIMFSIKK
ncbi:hypothetical protein BGZ82_010251 [Podila clonocystis]|nr:hypothetical protein BGZ82_010251 [Podila clonocystis]